MITNAWNLDDKKYVAWQCGYVPACFTRIVGMAGSKLNNQKTSPIIQLQKIQRQIIQRQSIQMHRIPMHVYIARNIIARNTNA